MSSLPVSSDRSLSRWQRLALELSPKPFFAVDGRSYADTARLMMRNWLPLIGHSESLALLLFIGDGNEVMEWSGQLQQPLEWAKYIGFCNQDGPDDLYYSDWYSKRPGHPFRDNLPTVTYADLQEIIQALRDAAREVAGIETCQIGAGVDPGPEFSQSRFKYHEHLEVLMDYRPDGPRAAVRFVDFTKALHADQKCYAAFPDGIEEGTSFGTFLGRQFKSFCKTFEVDYLWLSNGMGYSPFAWSMCGEIFYEGSFHPERAASVRSGILDFWRDFRHELPDVPIEARGTNHSVGHDVSVYGTSHEGILSIGGLDAEPTNLPVLDANLLAKEVMVYLTRMAGTPDRRMIYRAYLNDPWFEQDPWVDIYDREPFEIYTAMSCARLRADGSLVTPTDISILSVDSEYGELSSTQALEVMPHYLRAKREIPTQVGPLTWVYPFDLYHRWLHDAPEHLNHAFFQDHLIWRSIEGGLPLNTVCPDDDFVTLSREGSLPRSVYLVPVVPGGEEIVEAALAFSKSGGDVIFVGPLETAPQALCDILGLDLAADALDGDFNVITSMMLDECESDVRWAACPLRHHAVTGGGGLREVDASSAASLVTLEQEGQRRAYAVGPVASGSGRVAWIRGTVPFSPVMPDAQLRPVLDDPTTTRRPNTWLRALLGEFGFVFRQDRHSPAVEPTRWFLKRRDGAFWFVGSKADTTVTTRIAMPDGAPLFTGHETFVQDGFAVETFGKTIYNETRFFVKTDRTARYAVRRIPALSGRSQGVTLLGATPDDVVTFYPSPTVMESKDIDIEVITSIEPQDISGGGSSVEASAAGADQPEFSYTYDESRNCILLRNISGPVHITW